MELSDIVYIMLAFLFARACWIYMKIREHAKKLAVLACKKENLQLLDGSVSLKNLRIERDAKKQFYLLRHFKFDFSVTGTERRTGIIALRGMQQQYLLLDLPEDVTITIKTEEE